MLIAADPQATPVPLSPELDLHGLLEGGKLAMALVDSVPAGVYGKQALTHLGLWDRLGPDAADVAQADNVRAALALVATGAAPYGVVYATDAYAEPRVHVVARFAPDSHEPIVYPAALTLAGAARPAAVDFIAALTEPAARDIFAAQGFTVPPSAPAPAAAAVPTPAATRTPAPTQAAASDSPAP